MYCAGFIATEGVCSLASEIIIGTIAYADEVRDRLNAELNFLTGEGLALELEEAVNPPWSFFILHVPRGKRQGEKGVACRFAVTKAVSDLFVNHVESNFVKKFISRSYNYWSASDREDLIERNAENMNKLRIVRRNRILQSLYDYLADSNVLMIEGFARFRLKGYWKQLQRMVKRTSQEFMAAKDYLEFVRLLRCFINMQEPKFGEVHIFINAEGTFFLCDEAGEVIRSEHLRTPSFTVNDGEFNYKDYLLSMLITMAPRSITFHVSDLIWDCDPLQTIQQVFGGRIARCPGCARCKQLHAHKK
jgi:putative sporulation protein YtxC